MTNGVHSTTAPSATPSSTISSSSIKGAVVTPSSSNPVPSPSASPTLQSYLKPTSSALWSEMEDDDELPHPLSPRKEKIKSIQHQPQQQQQQQQQQQHVHVNGKHKQHQHQQQKQSAVTSTTAASDRFARPSSNGDDSVKSKPYQPAQRLQKKSHSNASQ